MNFLYVNENKVITTSILNSQCHNNDRKSQKNKREELEKHFRISLAEETECLKNFATSRRHRLCVKNIFQSYCKCMVSP